LVFRVDSLIDRQDGQISRTAMRPGEITGATERSLYGTLPARFIVETNKGRL
jgi:hypothetical protein